MLIPVPSNVGLPVLGVLVFGESAGLPIPGETALLAAGGLVAAGHLPFAAVVGVAVLAAVCGDTLGFLLGRRHGRRLLLRDAWGAAHRRRAVARADAVFARSGAAAVFFGRWVPGVRVAAAMLAGATQMPWHRFAVANLAGATAWASSVVGIAVLIGPSGTAGLAAAGLLAGAAAGVVLAVRHRRTPELGV